MLHGGIMFTRIREHIYRGTMGGTLTELVALHVRTWLPGAIASIGRLHAERLGVPASSDPRVQRFTRSTKGVKVKLKLLAA